MSAGRRRRGTRAVPILCLSFGWTRHRPYSVKASRIVGGPDTRKYSLFVPIDRRTLHEWTGAHAAGAAGARLYGAPSGTLVTSVAADLSGSFVAASLPLQEEERSWSVNVEVLDPEHVRLAIFSKNRNNVDSPMLGPRELRWLKLYWAAPEDEAAAFEALAEVAPAAAVEIYLNGFELKGQADSERHRIKAPQPSWLAPVMEHGDRPTRERAIAAVGSRSGSIARQGQ